MSVRSARWGSGLLRAGLWLALPLALAWGLRRTNPAELAAALGALSLLEVLALFGLNALVVLALSGRWWALLRGRGFRIPYLTISAYRLAGFSVSYFTPGSHFGGEPLQVHLVNRRDRVPLPVATASVVLDKTIEMIANFGFLAGGLGTVVGLGLSPVGASGVLLGASLALLLVPVGYLGAIWRGNRPATRLAASLGARPGDGGWRGRVTAWLQESEGELRQAARGSGAAMWNAAGFSVLSWVLLLGEWWLALRFLEIPLGAAETVAVVTAARLALFFPLPGAAGALEAALLFGLGRLGYNAAQAISVALVIRARDLAFGGFGLWLGGWLAAPRSRPRS